MTGYWQTGTEGSVVEILSCGDRICGRVVTLPPGGPTTDRNNRDDRMKSRPLCNLVIMTGFRQTSAEDWQDGSIYDPVSGNTYAARMTLSSDDRLNLRGYVGLPLFGRTETWMRAVPPVKLCG